METLCFAEPTAAFLCAGGNRLNLYLWKCRKCRFLRLPSGVGLYVFGQYPFALYAPHGGGERICLDAPYFRAMLPYYRLLTGGFRPVPLLAFQARLKEHEWRTNAIRALSVRELRQCFGCVRITPEDAYAAGHCWFGSKSWGEDFCGDACPTIERALSLLESVPGIERAAFVSAAAYAAAYVVCRDDSLLTGVDEADCRAAEARFQKADGSGAFRAPHMGGTVQKARRPALLASQRKREGAPGVQSPPAGV